MIAQIYMIFLCNAYAGVCMPIPDSYQPSLADCHFTLHAQFGSHSANHGTYRDGRVYLAHSHGKAWYMCVTKQSWREAR